MGPAIVLSSPAPVELQIDLKISPIALKATQRKKKIKLLMPLTTSDKMGRRVSNSLVSVMSPHGKATGFFIDGKGHILTAGFVVGHTQEELKVIKNEKAMQDQIVDLEQKRLIAIRQKITLLLPGYEKEKFQSLYDEEKKELFKGLERSQELADLLQNEKIHVRNNGTGIKVLTRSGKRLKVKKITLSAGSDMALLQVNTARLNYTPLRPRPIPFKAGDSVFSAGYSRQHGISVREGRIQNTQRMKNREPVCSDIKIVGHGEPLLDKYGNVGGLNSKLLKDNHGNDCAIPILAAYDYFRPFLIPQIRAVKFKNNVTMINNK